MSRPIPKKTVIAKTRPLVSSKLKTAKTSARMGQRSKVVVESTASTEDVDGNINVDVDGNGDVDVEFDDEDTQNTNSVLDDFLLASRNDKLTRDDSDDELSRAPIKKEMVGSKAKLLALMASKAVVGDGDEDDRDAENDNSDEGEVNEADVDVDVELSGHDDHEDRDEDRDVDHDDRTDDYATAKTTQNKKARKTIVKSKKTTKSSTVKRGPGRPPKTQKKDPIPRKGAARSPHDSNNFVEFLYDQPVVMKKIFSFFKSVAASEIQILFRQRDIIFYGVDHNEKTRIRIRVDAEKLNHYYCRDVLDVGISQKEMEMILNKVDKDYSSMVILSDNTTTRRNLTIVFENDIRIDELHRIDLIASYNKMEDESAFIDEDYTIKFNFPGKYFKKTVSDIKSMSSQLSITQEDSDSPLIFEYLTENKRIQSKHTVKDSNKIKLVSNLSDGESFRVDVCIDYLKPISSSQIADEITILVDENKAFMTKSYIDDGTIEIKTLTEIIDERPESDDD